MTSWVVAKMANADADEPRPHAHCTRCGERLITDVPMPLDLYVMAMRGFIETHRACKPRPEE